MEETNGRQFEKLVPSRCLQPILSISTFSDLPISIGTIVGTRCSNDSIRKLAEFDCCKFLKLLHKNLSNKKSHITFLKVLTW